MEEALAHKRRRTWRRRRIWRMTRCPSVYQHRAALACVSVLPSLSWAESVCHTKQATCSRHLPPEFRKAFSFARGTSCFRNSRHRQWVSLLERSVLPDGNAVTRCWKCIALYGGRLCSPAVEGTSGFFGHLLCWKCGGVGVHPIAAAVCYLSTRSPFE